MKKINEINEALETFKKAAIKHAEATESGDYKTGNKCFREITKSVDFLKKENKINLLKKFLSHASIGLRIWSSSYLLSINDQESKKVLEEIAKSSGIHSLTANTTLTEWKKGNLII